MFVVQKWEQQEIFVADSYLAWQVYCSDVVFIQPAFAELIDIKLSSLLLPLLNILILDENCMKKHGNIILWYALIFTNREVIQGYVYC